MKKISLFKLIGLAFLTALAFGLLSSYFVQKAQSVDPDISKKIETSLRKYFNNKNIHFNMSGISKSTENAIKFNKEEVITQSIESVAITIISGKINLVNSTDTTNLNNFKINTVGVSKDGTAIDIDLQNTIADCNLATASGDIKISRRIAKSTDIFTLTGDVALNLSKSKKEKYKFDLNTVSGHINNTHGHSPNNGVPIKISTTSGDISID